MGERQAVGVPAAASARAVPALAGVRRNALFSAAFLLTATDSRLPWAGATAETATVQYNRSM